MQTLLSERTLKFVKVLYAEENLGFEPEKERTESTEKTTININDI